MSTQVKTLRGDLQLEPRNRDSSSEPQADHQRAPIGEETLAQGLWAKAAPPPSTSTSTSTRP